MARKHRTGNLLRQTIGTAEPAMKIHAHGENGPGWSARGITNGAYRIASTSSATTPSARYGSRRGAHVGMRTPRVSAEVTRSRLAGAADSPDAFILRTTERVDPPPSYGRGGRSVRAAIRRTRRRSH